MGWYRSGEDAQAKIPALSTYLGHREPGSTSWYPSSCSPAPPPARDRRDGDAMTLIASTPQAFFTERLSQRHASPRTIAAYRDTLNLLLIFVYRRSGKPPIRLDWDDLDHDRGVLNHLESDRHNSVRTRNVR